jgi:hypothetical protein
MRSTCVTRLALETMESRALPSAAWAWPAAFGHGPHAALASPGHDDGAEGAAHFHGHGDARTPATAALTGWLAGQVRVTATSDHADAGTAYSLSGKAQLAGLGEVAVAGVVQGTGFVALGHATGRLTLTKLTDPGSTLTLTLTGPRQPGLAALPGSWTVHASGGTGAFAHMHGHAALTLNVAMNATPDRGTFHGSV